MKRQLYSVFKLKESDKPNDLIFSQRGYFKRKVDFEMLRLLILHFEDRSFHFLAQGMECIEYHKGDEFTKFLKTNKVQTAEYFIDEVIDIDKKLFKQKNGHELYISMSWINTGYDYLIKDPAEIQPTLQFQVGKAGRFKIDLDSQIKTVEFVHQGDSADPKFQEAFDDVRKSKKNDRVTGCLTALAIIIVFILFGKLWGWIFGTPDDPFNMVQYLGW